MSTHNLRKKPEIQNFELEPSVILALLTSSLGVLTTLVKTIIVSKYVWNRNPGIDQNVLAEKTLESANIVLNDYIDRITPFNQDFCELASASHLSSPELGLFFIQKTQAFVEELKQKLNESDQINNPLELLKEKE